MRISDWSSDVCSSDLFVDGGARFGTARVGGNMAGEAAGANRPGERGADKTGSEQCHPLEQRRVVSPAMSRRGHCTASASASAVARMRSEEHTSELTSLMRLSYAVFCLQKKTKKNNNKQNS